MTASYSIPETISPYFRFRSKPVNPHNIKVIIPTYRDWDGLRVTLDSLLNLKTPPKKISVVNDNKEPDVPKWLKKYPVEIANHKGNSGPATARNRGFGLRSEPPPGGVPALDYFSKVLDAATNRQPLPDYIKNGFCPELKYQHLKDKPNLFVWDSNIHWYYFTDCGCTHEPDLFLKFERAWEECGDCCVAISGPVTGSGKGEINDFMTEQGILNPPSEKTVRGVYIPQAVVTANVLGRVFKIKKSVN